MSPEILFRYQNIDKTIDIFSLGLICYEIIFGRQFLSGDTD